MMEILVSLIFDFSILFRSLFVENWFTVDPLNVGSTSCNAASFFELSVDWANHKNLGFLRSSSVCAKFFGGRTETLNMWVSRWMRNRSLDGLCSLCILKRITHLISMAFMLDGNSEIGAQSLLFDLFKTFD